MSKPASSNGNDQFLSMAMAYIEIGRVSAMAETELKYDSEYQNAVAYQMLHAVELFFKHMIRNKEGTVAHIHDLRALQEKYYRLYTADVHKIHHPFDVSAYEPCQLNEDEASLTESHLAKFSPEFLDQHLRYPADGRTGGYSFSIDGSIFEGLKNEMLRASASGC